MSATLNITTQTRIITLHIIINAITNHKKKSKIKEIHYKYVTVYARTQSTSICNNNIATK